MKTACRLAMVAVVLGATAGCCVMDRPRCEAYPLATAVQETVRTIVRPPRQWCWPYTPVEDEFATRVPNVVIEGVDDVEVPA